MLVLCIRKVVGVYFAHAEEQATWSDGAVEIGLTPTWPASIPDFMLSMDGVLHSALRGLPRVVTVFLSHQFDLWWFTSICRATVLGCLQWHLQKVLMGAIIITASLLEQNTWKIEGGLMRKIFERAQVRDDELNEILACKVQSGKLESQGNMVTPNHGQLFIWAKQET